VNIKPFELTVGALADDYLDSSELGARAYAGKLNIRPPYQREFVYTGKQRQAVIETASKDFPLNVMYWAVNGDDEFEVIDGQQRTISLCQYLDSEFALALFGKPEQRYFHNLQSDEQERLRNYKVTIYLCEGTPSEKLDWFKVINTAGEKLTDQELLNAIYSGPWVADAKRYFSKTSCPAYQLASDYMTGAPIRQDYLEKVIDWINSGDVEGYMGLHQEDPNAAPLWQYFQAVIAWVKAVFPNYRSTMRTVKWGALYNDFKDSPLNSVELEDRVSILMVDDEVQKRGGIYSYVLTGDDRYLGLRVFSENQKRAQYEKQNGVCPVCGKTFAYEEMAGDHIAPWSKGGKTIPANLQMLCSFDNNSKGSK
jgi:hypothetical protein